MLTASWLVSTAVNQLTEEVYNFELQLQQIQSRIYQRRKSSPQQVTFKGHDPTPEPPPLPRHQSTSVLECNPTPASLQAVINTLPHRCATCSESSLMGPAAQLGKRILSALDGGMKQLKPEKVGFPKTQSLEFSHLPFCWAPLRGYLDLTSLWPCQARPRSEDGDREHVCDGMPIKRQAWHTE